VPIGICSDRPPASRQASLFHFPIVLARPDHRYWFTPHFLHLSRPTHDRVPSTPLLQLPCTIRSTGSRYHGKTNSDIPLIEILRRRSAEEPLSQAICRVNQQRQPRQWQLRLAESESPCQSPGTCDAISKSILPRKRALPVSIRLRASVKGGFNI
jgi:hypothetical protein